VLGDKVSHSHLDWSGCANGPPSLARAEMYIVIATVFSRFEFQLYETNAEDVEMAHAYLLHTQMGIKGS
jgi:hypothetical protein